MWDPRGSDVTEPIERPRQTEVLETEKRSLQACGAWASFGRVRLFVERPSPGRPMQCPSGDPRLRRLSAPRLLWPRPCPLIKVTDADPGAPTYSVEVPPTCCAQPGAGRWRPRSGRSVARPRPGTQRQHPSSAKKSVAPMFSRQADGDCIRSVRERQAGIVLISLANT